MKKLSKLDLDKKITIQDMKQIKAGSKKQKIVCKSDDAKCTSTTGVDIDYVRDSDVD